jgi:hypothetical protein
MSSLQSLNADDALKFLLGCLKQNPDGYNRSHSNFGIYIPNVVEEFCSKVLDDTTLAYRDESKPIYLAFYDAAWQLCRMGILRPSALCPRGQTPAGGQAGDGYSLTGYGRGWLEKWDAEGFFPTDPDRYIQVLANGSALLGSGFLQRSHEAAKCYKFGAYIACCAMSGAAAESALLAVAIAKTRDEDLVLRKYQGRDGRREVMRLIFGKATHNLEARFKDVFGVLSYWRDSASHGQASDISELEAHEALARLLRLSRFVTDNWKDLTGRDASASASV